MTKTGYDTATQELTKLCKGDKAFMGLVGAVGITAISLPAFKAYLSAKDVEEKPAVKVEARKRF